MINRPSQVSDPSSLISVADVLAGLNDLLLLNSYGEPGSNYQGFQESFTQLSPGTRDMIRNLPLTQFDSPDVAHNMELLLADKEYRSRTRTRLGFDEFIAGIQRYSSGRPRMELISVTRNSPYEVVVVVVAAVGAATATATIMANRVRIIAMRYNQIRADFARTSVVVARSETQVAAYAVVNEMLAANHAAAIMGAEVADPSEIHLHRSIAALAAIEQLSVEDDATT